MSDHLIGDRISKLRTQKRISLQQMTGITGIDRHLLMTYENENIRPPEEHLRLIAEYLGVTEERLLGTDIDLIDIHVYDGLPEDDEERENFFDFLRQIKEDVQKRISPQNRSNS